MRFSYLTPILSVKSLSSALSTKNEGRDLSPKEKLFENNSSNFHPTKLNIWPKQDLYRYQLLANFDIYFEFCNFRSLKWICDFIVVQCSRPRQAHSKDLHSTIVAAFHCCKTWILHHPYLLQDKDCIATVLEVIELGISGTKSQAKTNEPVVMKDKKISQPASRRVKEGFCT